MIANAERRSAMHDLGTSAGQLAYEASRVNAPNNDDALRLWLTACVKSAEHMGVELLEESDFGFAKDAHGPGVGAPDYNPSQRCVAGSEPEPDDGQVYGRINDVEHAWAEAILWEIDHLAAKLYDYIGTNGQEGNSDELLDEYNRYVKSRCPSGHRGFPS